MIQGSTTNLLNDEEADILVMAPRNDRMMLVLPKKEGDADRDNKCGASSSVSTSLRCVASFRAKRRLSEPTI
jgi:hypothetical protein